MLEGILPEYGYPGSMRERMGNIAHNSAPDQRLRVRGRVARLHRRQHDPAVQGPVPASIGRDDLADDRALWTNQGAGAPCRGARRGDRRVDEDADRR